MNPNPESRPRKRIGCIVLASLLFAFWLAGAWLLWQWSLSMPQQQDGEERSTLLELMPKAEGS